MKSEDYIGLTVKDRITGFEGMCIGITKWITGCDQLAIQPKITMTPEGPKRTEAIWYDVLRCEVIEGGEVWKPPVPVAVPGG